MQKQQFPYEQIDSIYRDVILDHHRNPRNHDPIADPDMTAEEINPFCGDEITLQLKLDSQGRVSAVAFQGKGCSISQASASMMTEAMVGKSLVELEELASLFRQMMQGKTSAEEAGRMGSLTALEAVRLLPVRVKCTLLAWSALEQAIQGYSRKT